MEECIILGRKGDIFLAIGYDIQGYHSVSFQSGHLTCQDIEGKGAGYWSRVRVGDHLHSFHPVCQCTFLCLEAELEDTGKVVQGHAVAVLGISVEHIRLFCKCAGSVILGIRKIDCQRCA